jgi:hypothetical protein
LTGQTFFDGRPTSYWRKTLLADYRRGIIGETSRELFIDPDAVPVLLELLQDSDTEIRRMAAKGLSKQADKNAASADEALGGLRKALADDDTEVRVESLKVLTKLGPKARTATPEITALLSASAPKVAYNADLALWSVDEPAAPKVCGWKPFTSDKFGFSAEFPAAPKEEEKSGERWGQKILVHSFTASHGATACLLEVADYPEQILRSVPEAQRLTDMAEWIRAGMDGQVVAGKPITGNGLAGHEDQFSASRDSELYARQFWVGRRLYVLTAGAGRDSINRAAAKHFFESFKATSFAEKGTKATK